MHIPFKDIKILFTSKTICNFPFRMFIMSNLSLGQFFLGKKSHTQESYPLTKTKLLLTTQFWEKVLCLYAMYDHYLKQSPSWDALFNLLGSLNYVSSMNTNLPQPMEDLIILDKYLLSANFC